MQTLSLRAVRHSWFETSLALAELRHSPTRGLPGLSSSIPFARAFAT